MLSIRPNVGNSSVDTFDSHGNETAMERIGNAMKMIGENPADYGNQTDISMSGENFIVGVILAGKGRVTKFISKGRFKTTTAQNILLA